MWDRTGLHGKTLWGWLQLLIVPLVLALVGLWLTNATQSQQQMLEDQRAEAQWRIEEQRAQDAALQDYLGTMKEKLFGIF